MAPEYLNFSRNSFFYNHSETYPKVYWPSLQLLYFEDIRKLEVPKKPIPPEPLGCLGFLTGSYYENKRELKEYKLNIRRYLQVLDSNKSTKEYISLRYDNPWFCLPDSRWEFVYRIISRSENADYVIHTQKGAIESHFYLWLLKYFGDKISNNITIKQLKEPPFVPDFVYYDSSTNLHIDIEVDEPYSFLTGEPTHYDYVTKKDDAWEVSNKDDFKASLFSRKGWFTIRFSEEQVLNSPQSCCKVIFNLIKSVSLVTTFSIELLTVKDIVPQKSWTIIDCIDMSNRRYRENYLKSKNKRSDFHIDEKFSFLINTYNEYLESES